MNPRIVSCPTCHAEPWQRCNNPYRSWHESRQRLAAYRRVMMRLI